MADSGLLLPRLDDPTSGPFWIGTASWLWGCARPGYGMSSTGSKSGMLALKLLRIAWL